MNKLQVDNADNVQMITRMCCGTDLFLTMKRSYSQKSDTYAAYTCISILANSLHIFINDYLISFIKFL